VFQWYNQLHSHDMLEVVEKEDTDEKEDSETEPAEKKDSKEESAEKKDSKSDSK